MGIHELCAGCLLAAMGTPIGITESFQNRTVPEQVTRACTESFKGVVVQGVVSDRGGSQFYNVALDFVGKGLLEISKAHLLPGYSVQGVDGSWRTLQGEIRVSAVYAWDGGDFHDWTAYFRTSTFVEKVILKKERHVVGTLGVSLSYGKSPRFSVFSVQEGHLRWRTDLNWSEAAVSTNAGASWFTNELLRSSANIVDVDAIAGSARGGVLVLVQGYEKGVVYVDCLQYRRDDLQ